MSYCPTPKALDLHTAISRLKEELADLYVAKSNFEAEVDLLLDPIKEKICDTCFTEDSIRSLIEEYLTPPVSPPSVYPGTGWWKDPNTGVVYCKDVPEGETHIFDGDPKEYLSVYDYMNESDIPASLAKRDIILDNIERVATSNMTDFNYLFTNSITDESEYVGQDLSHLDTSNVISMGGTFYNTQVTEVKGIENFDTSKIGLMPNGRDYGMKMMFFQAPNFNQDLSMLCVSKIPNEPDNFSSGCDAWTLPKPIWGTCPRGEDI